MAVAAESARELMGPHDPAGHNREVGAFGCASARREQLLGRSIASGSLAATLARHVVERESARCRVVQGHCQGRRELYRGVQWWR